MGSGTVLGPARPNGKLHHGTTKIEFEAQVKNLSVLRDRVNIHEPYSSTELTLRYASQMYVHNLLMRLPLREFYNSFPGVPDQLTHRRVAISGFSL